MIWVAYLALAFAVMWAVAEGSALTLPALSPIAQQVIRAVTLLFGLLATVAAVALLLNLRSDPHHALSDDAVPYLFVASLGTGGLIYAAGTALWWGATAQLLRALGWALIVLPMTYPSTMTLALVLAAPLVVTVVARLPAQTTRPASPGLESEPAG